MSEEVSQSTLEGAAYANVPEAQAIDWSAYAVTYDNMCDHSPAYQQNMERLRSFIRASGVPADARVCDLGAGTGNFILAASDLLPGARFVHVDADRGMTARAETKYRAAGLDVEIVRGAAQHVLLDEQGFDLVICVNALYAMRPHEDVLRNVRRWLEPDGRFFVIDTGRKMRVLGWTLHVLRDVVRTQGFAGAVRYLSENYEVIKQNRTGSKVQTSGGYWLHSTEEFVAALEAAGFVVETSGRCYRRYADFAYCRQG